MLGGDRSRKSDQEEVESLTTTFTVMVMIVTVAPFEETTSAQQTCELFWASHEAQVTSR